MNPGQIRRIFKVLGVSSLITWVPYLIGMLVSVPKSNNAMIDIATWINGFIIGFIILVIFIILSLIIEYINNG